MNPVNEWALKLTPSVDVASDCVPKLDPATMYFPFPKSQLYPYPPVNATFPSPVKGVPVVPALAMTFGVYCPVAKNCVKLLL